MLFLFITLVLPYPEGKWLKGDVDLYNFWAKGLVKGIFPIDDSMWQYPPLAGVVFAIPQWLFGNALTGFIVFMIVIDLLILITLLIAGLNRFKFNSSSVSLNGLSGSWFWVLWPILMGPLALTRFDVVPTLFALLALIALSNKKIRPYLSGFLLGIGALVKLWPMLLFVVYPKKVMMKVSASFVTTLVLVVLFMSTWSVGFTNFLNNQTSRGLQVESIAATPFVLAKLLGANVEYPFRYGSLEVQAAFATEIGFLLNLFTLIVFIVLFVLNYQNKLNNLNLFDKALVIVMISIALSRVFSPQFWVWIGGLAALALINKETKLKKVIVLLSISAFLTQLLYPGQYVQLLSGEFFATLLQISRVTLFVWALVLGTKLLLKPTSGKVNEYV
ncbi:membrane protein [Actinomycetes bacterium]|nr:membrane protein [Actinomycetes bacterium]